MYDPIGRETTMTTTAEGEERRQFRTSYWPSGELSERTKHRGPEDVLASTERWFFQTDGSMARRQRFEQGASTPVEDHTYGYDANGNRTKDERGTHAFNARDQLVRWTKTDGSPDVVYELNGSGAITKETEGTRVETHRYAGDRLDSVEHADGSKSSYRYDDFGNVTRIESPDGVAEYRFDEFERMIGGHDAGQPDETFTYDGLDRRDSQTEDGQAWDLSYIGTSEQLSQEQTKDTLGVEIETRSYDYDASMDALGQSVRKPLQPSQYRSYTKDANGSVTGLEDGNGHVKTGTEPGSDGKSDQYKYDPYGDSLNENSLSSGAKANPLRFEGFYYDPGLKTYDMRARVYRPDVGRFLSQDRYEMARHDLTLQIDPLTQNRYAFAGGNPVSRVEWDGHAVAGCHFEDRVHKNTFLKRGPRTGRLRWSAIASCKPNNPKNPAIVTKLKMTVNVRGPDGNVYKRNPTVTWKSPGGRARPRVAMSEPLGFKCRRGKKYTLTARVNIEGVPNAIYPFLKDEVFTDTIPFKRTVTC